ncbi:MAG: hypothetical protein A2Z20_12250 [Bdellovibrionales bacterium RBG_16_40_8]|nr:MAG: hypothetical protein A2Z20_12250 [Bdellovibrionales bacterium RBG_16_40_8]
MELCEDIYTLINTKGELRDEAWENSFLKSLPSAKLRVLDESPRTGPDGWPYLMVVLDASGDESASKVLTWLSDKGIGLVINPQKESPDFVLSYGMVCNFRERGKFLSPIINEITGQVQFSAGEKVYAGEPSEDFLPGYSRSILRTFFQGNKIEKMKVLVVSPDQKHYDLCFSLEAFGLLEEKDHNRILESIAWFLPSHYSIVLISEKNLPPFYEL